MNRGDFLKTTATIVGGMGVASTTGDYASQFLHNIIEEDKGKNLAGIIEKMKKEFPHNAQWENSDKWAKIIENAFEKNNFPFTDENVGIVLTTIAHESGFRDLPRAYSEAITPSEKTISDLDILEVRTSGPMELSASHVMKEENLDLESSIDKLNKPEEGVFYGVKHLKLLTQIYSKVEDVDLRLKCIFADYNAGEYASRNAGLQRFLNKYLDFDLREDGLLLGDTKKAFLELLVVSQNKDLCEEDVMNDLNKSLTSDLEHTNTWLFSESLNHRKIDPIPADRPVLGVTGVLKKIFVGYDNSRGYAEERFKEFGKIINILKE